VGRNNLPCVIFNDQQSHADPAMCISKLTKEMKCRPGWVSLFDVSSQVGTCAY
jgi:hypothetical protein